MPLLVADCPRCGAESMTFDVTAEVFRTQEHGWLNTNEVFSVCRQCLRPSIFLIRMTLNGTKLDHEQSKKFSEAPHAIMGFKGALNNFFEVVRHISLRDVALVRPPDHLPEEIAAAFNEGAACHAIACYNAAGCMFRLCLDLVSRPLLPSDDNAVSRQPTAYQRRNLGPRLSWLFDQGLLPADLRGLAACVKDDGNDGAHVGNLTKEDAADLLDFTIAFLERLITEPKKLEAAEARRKLRRSQ